MKILFIPFLMLMTSLEVKAAFNEALVIKKISDDGNSFVFVRKEGTPPWNGITIKDPQTKATLYEARVLKCSATSCMAQIVKNHSGITFREDEDYLHSYNEKPIVYDAKPPTAELKDARPVVAPVVAPEVKPEVKPEIKIEPPPPVIKPEVKVEPPVPPPAPEVKPAPAPEPKPVPVAPVKAPVEKKKEIVEPEAPKTPDKEAYLAYGSPVGPGITLGYLKIKENFTYGVNYGNISSTTNSVNLKGHLLSGVAMYNALKPTPSTAVNLLMQLGVAKATLNFSGVDSEDGPTKDEMTYFLALGGEGRYNMGNFSVAAKMGMSKSGLAQNYDGQLNQYNNPYGTILVFVEVGMYYRF